MIRVVGKQGVGRVTVEFEVANNDDFVLARAGALDSDKVRHLTVKGIVDSGATKCVLPGSVVKQLGLTVSDKVRVRYADGRAAIRAVASGAQITLLGRKGTFSAVVEPHRKTALIGAIVLEDLDLLIDCTHNRLIPRDPRFIISEIE